MAEPRRRGRGARTAIADCPTCGDRCHADDTQTDAQRVWAQRHADRTGHMALVETIQIRSYKPRNRPVASTPERPGNGDA